MIEIPHEMIRYSVHFQSIFCCDCFYDEIYFLLRQKVKYKIFEARFLYEEGCFFNMLYEIAMVICHDLLEYSSQKYNLVGKRCITDLVNIKSTQIELCSICTVDVFRQADILHTFKLKW